ncbi:DUF3833 domain-containing protein [Octadecabacter sp. R77987]|uniref:DUF3833 domain-containing protein n=1 Tax=Octadecabacter sp. R77987 TaxID=3093874 RepID=UPI00367080D8
MTVFLSLIAGVALAVIAFLLIQSRFSFKAQRPEDYTAAGPDFSIREHLNGPIQCEGVIYGPTGRVTSRFVADFEASWQGNVGRMVERFEYDSGTVQNREWTLTVGNDGAIKATAPDVIGTGHGQQAGNSVVLNYRIKLADEAGGHILDTVDWMYLTANGTIMNRSQFRKYGIKVAELVATMRPKAA